MKTLYENGKIFQIGMMYINGDECDIFTHPDTGDIFVYVESESASTLISELGYEPSMKFLSDNDNSDDLVKAIAEAGQGAIGAIAHKDGTYTIIYDNNGALTAQHGVEVVELDMSMDVYPEDYDD